ncbi:LCP family protein [Streptomyces anandii]|uniref:LCP family protein n=1 Tax=Streptomyces anandii TaxID=285454 RepID=UPI0036F646C6
MSDPWDGPRGQATRSRTSSVPRQRDAEPGAGRPTDGRVASVSASRRASRARGGHGARSLPTSRAGRAVRIGGIGLALLALGATGAGWWVYQHLNGNINSVSLDGKGGTEKADAFGRTPINILVIGSDGRTSSEDCRLGGGCAQTGVQTQTSSNADVEMVVHVSADRSNATVMSIPRDTMTRVPACADAKTGRSTAAYYGQINSALQYGPACQVATVHQLTGIPIDHFVKLDFAGVVRMSHAVGGVSVCVSDNVYDTYSHLKLAKGPHTLKGVAALEFVRSRHGFGDGSDLGRTGTQHLFLSAVMRKLKSAGTLTDPAAVYGLADAATKALTVDDALGSVKKLVGLALDVNKVPARRMTFTTMPTAPDPANRDRVVVGAGAKALFAAVAGDRSLTTGSGGESATAAPSAKATAAAPAVPASRIAVTVENGTTITGRASAVATALTGQGFSPATTTRNAPAPATSTTLTYGAGQEAEARTAAEAPGLPASQLRQGSGRDLTLVVGGDWPSGTTYPDNSPPAAADSGTAVPDAHAQTADQARTCAPVSPYKTVSLDGIPMTPSQAYAAARGVPDSDA